MVTGRSAVEPIRYLLNTNILSHLIRDPQGPIRDRIAQATPEKVATSIIVACELRFGARKRSSARLTENVEAVLEAIKILPLEEGVDGAYAAIRLALELAGNMIGPNDLLIAAQARRLGLILVTDNEAEFRRVPELSVENWLR